VVRTLNKGKLYPRKAQRSTRFEGKHLKGGLGNGEKSGPVPEIETGPENIKRKRILQFYPELLITRPGF
jgi:hypothetical protein